MKQRETHDLIPVRIIDMQPCSDATPPDSYVVWLKGKGDKVVPVIIGAFEFRSLTLAQSRIAYPRPLTHNLFQSLLGKIKGELRQVVIHALKEEVFHAYLLIKTPEEEFSLDCRSSDGMVLATLMEVPIYISAAIMEEAGRSLREEADRELSGVFGFTEDDAGTEAIFDELQMDQAGEMEVGQTNFEDEEPSELDKLKAQLDRLVAEECYEEAAKLRDLIIQIEKRQSY